MQFYCIINIINNTMEQFIELLNSLDGDFEDYEKIINLCYFKIEELKFIDNIEYIKHIQSMKYNERIIKEFKVFCSENALNVTLNFENLKTIFHDTDFYEKIIENKFNKKKFMTFCEKIKNYDLSGTCISCYKNSYTHDYEYKNDFVKKLLLNSNSYTSLNLSYNNISVNGIEILIPILEKEKILKNINLSNSGMNDSCMYMLEKLLLNKNIKKIIVTNNDITSETKKIFKEKYGDIVIF